MKQDKQSKRKLPAVVAQHFQRKPRNYMSMQAIDFDLYGGTKLPRISH